MTNNDLNQLRGFIIKGAVVVSALLGGLLYLEQFQQKELKAAENTCNDQLARAAVAIGAHMHPNQRTYTDHVENLCRSFGEISGREAFFEWSPANSYKPAITHYMDERRVYNRTDYTTPPRACPSAGC